CDRALPAVRPQGSVDAALSRAGHGLRVGLDARACPRAPARGRTAAGRVRSCRLGRALRHGRGNRRVRDLGHARRRGCAGALVRHARSRGPAAAHGRLWRGGRGGGRVASRNGQREGGRYAMNRFAALLDRLAYEPGRNAKLRLLTDYFGSVPDPDRGYALAAITGALTFQHAKPGIIRALIAERTDPVLFEMSYDYVGDLSETVALMWPAVGRGGCSPSLACGGGRGEGGHTLGASGFPLPDPQAGGGKAAKEREGEESHHAPSLTVVVTTLASLGKTQLPRQLARWLH